MISAKKKIEAAQLLLGELAEIQKRPMKSAVIDFSVWMDKHLDEVGYLLGEAWNELDEKEYKEAFPNVSEYGSERRILAVN